MPLFLVAALGDSAKAIDAAVRETFPEKHYKIDDTKWFVNAKLATAKALSDQLGITSDVPDQAKSTGVVVSIRGYFGRGPADLWEWIASQASTPE
jgi:hypothetical protein